jgi:putative effector of murein hydrolase
MKYDIYDQVRDWLRVLLLLAVIVVPLAIFLYQDASCRDRGGVFVKAAFWYGCVAGK